MPARDIDGNTLMPLIAAFAAAIEALALMPAFVFEDFLSQRSADIYAAAALFSALSP